MNYTLDIGSAVQPADGFTSCGDAVWSVVRPGFALIVLVDALGHGPDAQTSAERVVATLEAAADRSLSELFSLCDQRLRGLRGAVMSAARVDERGARFAGIGNVEILGPPGVSRPPTTPGILGRGIRGPREHELLVAAGQRWALLSDGLRRRMVPAVLEELRRLPAQPAAKDLLSRTRRTDDDASVLLVDFGEAA